MGIIQRILGVDSSQDNEPLDLRDNTDDKLLNQGTFIEKRVRGKITRVDTRGFGFISSLDIPYTRIFFHWSGLLQSTRNFKDLDKGLTVEFNPFLIEGKGYRALKIEVVDEAEVEGDYARD